MRPTPGRAQRLPEPGPLLWALQACPGPTALPAGPAWVVELPSGTEGEFSQHTRLGALSDHLVLFRDLPHKTERRKGSNGLGTSGKDRFTDSRAFVEKFWK